MLLKISRRLEHKQPAGSDRVDQVPATGQNPFLRITDRLFRHKSLNINRKLYRDIIENIHDGILVVDASSSVVYINEKMANKLGYRVQDLVGRNIEEYMDEDGMKVVRQTKERYRFTSSTQSDIKVRCKDGTDVWLLVSVTPVYDQTGRLIGSYGVLTDIQQRKQDEMHFQLLSAALEAISDCVVIINGKCDIIWSNHALAELTGYRSEEISGQHISILLPEDDESIYRKLCHHVETGRPWSHEFVNRKKDQSVYHEKFNLIPISLVRNRAERYFVIVKYDRSRQYEMQQAQQLINEKAEKLAIAEMRAQLSRELHDSVSQLIYSMTILAETGKRLIRANDLENLQENQEHIYLASRQALREIRLLVYELRPHELEKEGLVTSLRRRLDSVERRAGLETHLILKNYVEQPKNIEQELFNIVQEALNNVVKHSQADMVVVSLSCDEQYLTLDITDNGLGIEHSRMDTGGIGLSSMKERAEHIGGVLHIFTPDRGGGTRVLCRIPRAKLL